MRTAKPKAFTLIELLVVVTIIVILIAILVPSLERGMSQAQTASCMANCHTAARSYSMYLSDFDRVFPYGNTVPPGQVQPPGTDNPWGTLSETNVDPDSGSVTFPSSDPDDYNGAAGWPGRPQQQLLFEYGKSGDYFICNTDPSPQNYSWWEFWNAPDYTEPNPNSNTGGTRLRGSSYEFSENIMRTGERGSVFKMSDIVGRADNLGLMADGNWSVNGWWWINIDPNSPARPREWPLRIDRSHNRTVNFLMGDFSVRRVSQYNPEEGSIHDRVRSDPWNP